MGIYNDSMMKGVAEIMGRESKDPEYELKLKYGLCERVFKSSKLPLEYQERYFYRDICWDYWNKGILSQILTIKVMERLNCPLNIKAAFRLQELVFQLYNNATYSFDIVSGYGSYELGYQQVNQVAGNIMNKVKSLHNNGNIKQE
jgi:hypothetical protein